MSQEFGNEYRPHDIGLGGYLDIDVVNRINIQLQSPEQMFYTALATSFDIINNILHLQNPELIKRNIESFASQMPHMAYKNASAFILGCLASKNNDGKTLSAKEVAKITNILNTFAEENIQKADIIRYARFAMLNRFTEQ